MEELAHDQVYAVPFATAPVKITRAAGPLTAA